MGARTPGYEFSDDRRGGIVWQVGDNLISVCEEFAGIEGQSVLIDDSEVLKFGEFMRQGVGEFRDRARRLRVWVRGGLGCV